MRCPHERKEGIEPVCFSSPEETGGGDTTCRCGSHAAATCMWAAGARVRLCLLCCLCVRGAGAPPAPLRRRRQGQEWQFSVCVCVCVLYPCAPRCCVRCPCAVPVGVRWAGSAARAPSVPPGFSLCRGGVGKGTSVCSTVLFHLAAKVSWHSPGAQCQLLPLRQSKSLLLKPQGRLSTRDVLGERRGEVPECSREGLARI